MSHSLEMSAPRRRGLLPVLLSAVLSTLLVACSGAADTSESDAAPESNAAAESAETSKASSSSGMPPLPDAASTEGKLPRSYAGLTLGDPVPANAEKLDGPPPHYPKASQYMVRVPGATKTTIGLYVYEDAIFRIEWRTKDASIDRDEVAEVFSERLGPPEEPSEYLPQTNVYWTDGLSDGDTTISIFRLKGGGEWFRVAFEDTGRTVALLNLK